MAYDSWGNQVWWQDAQGNAMARSYDGAGLLVRQSRYAQRDPTA